MRRYLISRLLQGGLVVFGVTVVVFVATRMIGDPVNFILPLSASLEQRERLRADLGFDRPIIVQFWDYITDVFTLDFGTSTKFTNEETIDVVFRFLPKTLQLVAAGMLVAFVVSLVLGMLSAVKPGKITDKLLSVSASSGSPCRSSSSPRFSSCCSACDSAGCRSVPVRGPT